MGCVADEKDATGAVAVGDEGPGAPGHRAVDGDVEVGYTYQGADHRNSVGGNRIWIKGLPFRPGSEGEPVVVACVAAGEQQSAPGRSEQGTDPTSAQCRFEVGVEQDAEALTWNGVAVSVYAEAGPDRSPRPRGAREIGGREPSRARRGLGRAGS